MFDSTFNHLKGEDPAEEHGSETGTTETTLEMRVSEVMRAFWPGCSRPRSRCDDRPPHSGG